MKMMKKTADRGMIPFYIFYFVYFLSLGCSMFISKYYVQIGLNDGQIGILSSVPSLIAMCFLPLWGMLSDRAKDKRTVLFLIILITAIIYFFVGSATDFSIAPNADGTLPPSATNFWLLLAITIVYTIFQQGATPNMTSLSLEYTQSVGKSFGPIRMLGTIGYQVTSLATGFIFVSSLRGLYAFIGVILICSSFCAFLLPKISGHQYGRKKVSMLLLFKNKRLIMLIFMAMLGTITSMYYNSFFGAYLGELKVSNSLSSVIMFISVFMELPMLLFADKIMRKASIWQWLLIGYLLNGVRWLGLMLAGRLGSWPMLLVFNLPAVSVMACFEFFPSVYISRIVAPEFSSTSQSLMTFATWGISKIFGTLLAGFVAQFVGSKGLVFGFNGAMLLVLFVIFFIPARKFTKADREEGLV